MSLACRSTHTHHCARCFWASPCTLAPPLLRQRGCHQQARLRPMVLASTPCLMLGEMRWRLMLGVMRWLQLQRLESRPWGSAELIKVCDYL